MENNAGYYITHDNIKMDFEIQLSYHTKIKWVFANGNVIKSVYINIDCFPDYVFNLLKIS